MFNTSVIITALLSYWSILIESPRRFDDCSHLKWNYCSNGFEPSDPEWCSCVCPEPKITINLLTLNEQRGVSEIYKSICVDRPWYPCLTHNDCIQEPYLYCTTNITQYDKSKKFPWDTIHFEIGRCTNEGKV